MCSSPVPTVSIVQRGLACPKARGAQFSVAGVVKQIQHNLNMSATIPIIAGSIASAPITVAIAKPTPNP